VETQWCWRCEVCSSTKVPTARAGFGDGSRIRLKAFYGLIVVENNSYPPVFNPEFWQAIDRVLPMWRQLKNALRSDGARFLVFGMDALRSL
jgi:hypothetical protein